MSDLAINDKDGDILATRMWFNVPDELVQHICDMLGPAVVSSLVSPETQAAGMAAMMPTVVVDVNLPDA